MELKIPIIFVNEFFENPNGYIKYKNINFELSNQPNVRSIEYNSSQLSFSFPVFPFLVHVFPQFSTNK